MDQNNTQTDISVDETAEETTAEQPESTHKSDANKASNQTHAEEKPKEYGGPKGPEPTRYGDWEKRGRCIDF